MPERLDRVTIAMSRGDVVIPWDSREALLGELAHLESGHSIRAAFDAVGASRPVDLTAAQKVELLRVIEFWSKSAGGYDALPDGIDDLRGALIDDIRNGEQRRG